jgi:hypothetical protein
MRDYLTEYCSTQENGFRSSAGVGYVIIAAKDNAPRDKYILDCTLKGCVTIALDNGGFIENVPVLKHVWNDIVFPDTKDNLGSCVFWTNIPHSNLVIVQGVIQKSNEVFSINENEFSLNRKFSQLVGGKQISNNIEISGNAKEGKINITVDGGEDSGELLINITNKNKSAKASLNVKGLFNIDTSGDIQINSATKVTLGKGKDKSEGITLGKKCKKMFDDFIDQVAQSTVTTAMGVMPLMNATQIEQLKQSTEKIISTFSFTD